MQQRHLGRDGLAVSAIGLGAMGMSDFYGPADDATSEATINRALDLAVTLIDTADFYGNGHNEMLIGRAIRGRRDEVTLSVKFGAMRTPSGGFGALDGRPVAVRNSAAYSLRRLGVETIDLYTPARVDPTVPIEETVGAMSELVAQGYLRYVGLSEVDPDQVRRAHAVHPITAVQIEYSLWTRDIEAELLPVLRELGIGLVAYSPLSRGFLTGTIRTPDDLPPNDYRRHSPRFQAENFNKNVALVDTVKAVAERKRCTPAQIALAWVLSRGEDVVPIVGTRSSARLEENLGAIDVVLDAADLAQLDAVDAVSGDRYPGEQMRLVYTRRAPLAR